MRFAKSTKLIVFIVGILFLLQLLVSSKLTAIGGNIAELEKKTLDLEKENRLLEQKVASTSALTEIKNQAEQIGLNNKAEVLFVNDSYYMVAR